MDKYKKIKLKSGAAVYFLVNSKFTTSTVQVVFPIGWRQDEKKYTGLAHLFEHLVGKRTKKYPQKSEFSHFLEKNGIMTNAYTSPDVTCYHHSQTNDKLLFSLSMLLEAIYNSYFDAEDLEKEKKVVLTEGREYEDNDDLYLWHKLMGNLFPKTTLEKFFFGNVESMQNIDLNIFNDFYEYYLDPKNATFFIGTSSAKDEKKICKMLDKFYADKKELKNIFTKKPILKVNEKITDLRVGDEHKYLQIDRPGKQQSNIRLAFKIPMLSNKERIAFVVMRRILASGFSSRLIKRLRDEEGLIYWINFYRDYFVGDISYCVFSTGCEKEKKEHTFKCLLEELDKFYSEVNAEEVKNVIPMVEFLEAKEINVNSEINSLIESVIYDQNYISSKEFLKLIKQVNVNDVKKIIKKIFVPENSLKVVLE